MQSRKPSTEAEDGILSVPELEERQLFTTLFPDFDPRHLPESTEATAREQLGIVSATLALDTPEVDKPVCELFMNARAGPQSEKILNRKKRR